jgi:hypothetical protein
MIHWAWRFNSPKDPANWLMLFLPAFGAWSAGWLVAPSLRRPTGHGILIGMLNRREVIGFCRGQIQSMKNGAAWSAGEGKDGTFVSELVVGKAW